MKQDEVKARRGRPALPAEEVKGKNLTFRTRGALRDQIDAAAADAGRSISEEVEYRLVRSFDRTGDDFGSAALHGIMKAVAIAMRVTGESAMGARPDAAETWLNDPDAYDQAVKAAHRILEAFRPQGEIKQPVAMRFVDAAGNADAARNSEFDSISANMGELVANGMIAELVSDEPISSAAAERAPQLRKQIGNALVDRLKKAQGA